jgi:hypothetical protein
LKASGELLCIAENCWTIRTCRPKTIAGGRDCLARLRQACKTSLHKRQCKISRGKWSQKIFAKTLEIDSGFSNSIFAAFGGAGRQLLGPAD